MSAVAVDSELAGSLFDCTPYGADSTRDSDALRLCWFLPCVALVDAFAARRARVRRLEDALQWFTGDGRLSQRILGCFGEPAIASEQLARLSTGKELLELLLYAIEPHGHITRNDLETRDVARRTRALKKSTGIFYTPADVARFMIESVATAHPDSQPSVLDPACGTGAFLREALRLLARRTAGAPFDALEIVASQIFAMDNSALATDLAAFVLLTECMLLTPLRLTPFAAWQLIKGNLVCMDALRFADPSGDTGAAIERYFPRVRSSGFDCVVMNPPYSEFNLDSGHRRLWRSLEGCAPGSRVGAYVPFTEMLWRLTSPTGSAAAVLPLSVAANTLTVQRALRREMLRNAADREFLFFDRQPQALFGEDIKTRNLILIWRKHRDGRDSLKTSRLLRWSGQQRPRIFARERLVGIDASACERFIPKLGTVRERNLYVSLRRRVVRAAPACRRMALSEAAQLGSDLANRTLLVGGTAYNFINCFFATALPSPPPLPYSTSPISALSFATEAAALAGFAVLTSRLCFWLWHVEGDGFHLTADFLRRLPLWAVVDGSHECLAAPGGQLWDAAAAAIVGDVNRGKQTYSFHCGYNQPAVRAVERHLSDFYREETLSECLEQFVDAIGACRSLVRQRRKAGQGEQSPH
jgi:N-6 DNA Methylase